MAVPPELLETAALFNRCHTALRKNNDLVGIILQFVGKITKK